MGTRFTTSLHNKRLKILLFHCDGSAMCMQIGWLSDKANRCILLFVVVMFGTLPTLCTYWVNTYGQLLALRTLTGVSVGGVGAWQMAGAQQGAMCGMVGETLGSQ
jgi:sugar phosphate permease